MFNAVSPFFFTLFICFSEISLSVNIIPKKFVWLKQLMPKQNLYFEVLQILVALVEPLKAYIHQIYDCLQDIFIKSQLILLREYNETFKDRKNLKKKTLFCIIKEEKQAFIHKIAFNFSITYLIKTFAFGQLQLINQITYITMWIQWSILNVPCFYFIFSFFYFILSLFFILFFNQMAILIWFK